ncbi:MAG TPA: hypothetical protein VGO47_01130, partial [Chlamydiales bacterium]|nr:hypothetical protein [Chlamydiales bacterium]
AELTGIGNTGFWETKYGSEAMAALIHVLAPHLAAKGYPVGHTKTEVGQPLRTIVATSKAVNSSALTVLNCIMTRDRKLNMCDAYLFIHYKHNLPQKSHRVCVLL